MKKVYMKPELEAVSIISQEAITAEADAIDGSMGLTDAENIPWN